MSDTPEITLELIAYVKRAEENGWMGGGSGVDFQHGLLYGEAIFNHAVADQREIFDPVSDDLMLGAFHPLGNFRNKNWEH